MRSTMITTALGLRSATVRPRLHDLRHSWAVHTLSPAAAPSP
ncbi:MAG TPA: hypothetical protein VF302_12150 [Candidatus Limnocylindrales bacterium]